MEADIYEYLGGASALVKNLEIARAERQNIYRETVRLEKQQDVIARAISDETAITVKKRREELLAGYQQQLSEAAAYLKKLNDKKEAARSAGIKERIDRETAGLKKVTAQLEREQKKAMTEADVSGLFGKPFFFHLFLPSRAVDFLLLAAVFLLAAFLLPFSVCIQFTDSAFVTAGVLAGCGVFFSITYMLIHMKSFIPKKDSLEEINRMAMTIRENRREIRAIQAAITEDESDEYYHLDDYNYDIAKAEAARDEVKKRRESALANFDMVTQRVIEDEIRMGYDEQLTQLELAVETRRGDLEMAENRVRRLSTKAMDEYAGMLGKENLTTERIAGIERTARERGLTSVTEAVNAYMGNGL